jgi:hypothetical protein
MYLSDKQNGTRIEFRGRFYRNPAGKICRWRTFRSQRPVKDSQIFVTI